MSSETEQSTRQLPAGQQVTPSPSRQGRFPSLSISYRIAMVESKRQWRKLRDQDLWLGLMALGLFFVVISLPILFGISRDFGTDLAAGEASTSLAFVVVVIGWLGMLGFGIMSGVGSEGEVDNQAAILTIRPPKDVAGGLLLSNLIGYGYFTGPIALAGGIGLAVGAGSPLVLVGVVFALIVTVVTGVTLGFAVGLVLKGLFRQSSWLARLKPVLGLAVVFGYFWLSFTGRLGPIAADAGSVLVDSPLGWLGDLAFLTTPNAGASAINAAGTLILGAVIMPVGVLAVVRAAEYAWYVEQPERAEDESESEPTAKRSPALAERLDSFLGAVGVSPATQGVTTTVLVRGYRSPLQLIYVVAPLIFVLPMIETTVRTGFVPEWFPWAILLYGAWAGGASFPLNILGNQGATLPTLLSSRARGHQVVHGYILATVIVFVPLTAGAGVAAAHFAERSTGTLIAVGLATPVAVIAGGVLAAGIGAAFPRFSSIDLTTTRKARLPSKTAFALFSVAATFAVTAVSVLADDIYRLVMSEFLSTHLPYGITVDPSGLETLAQVAAGILLVVVPLAYLFARRRIDRYEIS